jgi:hypothetical protein
MPRSALRLILAAVLLLTFLGGLAISSGPARGSSGDGSFTTAEAVLSQSGTYGNWAMKEPPGFPPVTCTYPSVTSGFNVIRVLSPIVFPTVGFSSQAVRITLFVNRRLLDGRLVPVDSDTIDGVVTNREPDLGVTSVFAEDLGSTFVVTAHIGWFDNDVEQGSVDLLYTQYQTTLTGSPNQTFPVTDACYPPLPAIAQLEFPQGIVGSSLRFRIFRFPNDPGVGIFFDGKKIGSVATDVSGVAAGSFIVPAAPMGAHTVRFFRFGRNATQTFSIKPRIRLIPSANISRGHTVNVSLRGYAAHETVRIRWKKGSTFVQIATVNTSSTGSANIDIHVPTFVPDGPTSVRGDGTFGHAQTNAVTVLGGPFSGSTVKASPTPAKTITPTPTATPAPATATPQPTATDSPTEQVQTETATPTETPVSETATAEPAGAATPAIEPTDKPAIDTTAVPSETVDPTS